ncbi:hypothetical protein Sango_2687800 [Sesamum angolense]|uniref:Uncharacterized protein n=1 Tax=Sesamum angolense TaxID=2727404 RepID=A0AAE2BHJ1_9LAMI|nr:hypothetical protein Sango_2687800 [Sesamum angolense]
MLVNTVVRSCSIVVEGVTLYADLVVINLREFDVILGMDWLSCNHVLVDFQTKEVVVEVNGQMKTVIVGERKVIPNCLISAVIAFNLINGGCDAYLASVRDTMKVGSSISDVPVVREFPDVFPEELLGLPPHREVDFEIETIPGAEPISITPYRMAPLVKLIPSNRQLILLQFKKFNLLTISVDRRGIFVSKFLQEVIPSQGDWTILVPEIVSHQSKASFRTRTLRTSIFARKCIRFCLALSPCFSTILLLLQGQLYLQIPLLPVSSPPHNSYQ